MKGIIIGGGFCTGKSSAAQVLAKKLKAELFEVSQRIGKEDCINGNDANLISDNKAIQKISKNIEEDKNIVVVGRYPALWNYFHDKQFLRVLIYANDKTVVFRHIKQLQQKSQTKIKISDIFQKIKNINRCDSNKSKSLYGKNCFHTKNYDVMINASSYSPEEVANIIIMMYDMVFTKTKAKL